MSLYRATAFCIVLYCIPLLYKLTELDLYYIQVGLALPTRCIYKVHVFGYTYCTYYNNTCNKYQAPIQKFIRSHVY